MTVQHKQPSAVASSTVTPQRLANLRTASTLAMVCASVRPRRVHQRALPIMDHRPGHRPHQGDGLSIHVRLSVNPEPMFRHNRADDDPSRNISAISMMPLRMILAHDLAVVIDIHPESDFKAKLARETRSVEHFRTTAGSGETLFQSRPGPRLLRDTQRAGDHGPISLVRNSGQAGWSRS